jgi:hypothetical protein
MHRAAWSAAGLTATQIRELADGALRQPIEEESNRLDDPIYSPVGRAATRLLAGLRARPGAWASRAFLRWYLGHGGYDAVVGGDRPPSST